jgi:hypothetical protein
MSRIRNLALTVLLSVPAAGEAQPLGCGTAIRPGGTVVLSADIGPCAAGVALRVEGPVVVDLNGRTVSCAGLAADGIAVTGRNVHLRNGRVQGCRIGIGVRGKGHRLTDVRLRDSGIGVSLERDSESVRLLRVDPAVVQVGFAMHPTARRHVLEECDVTVAELIGFQVRGAQHRVEQCGVLGGAGVGFLVEGARHRLTENDASAIGSRLDDEPGDGYVVRGKDHVLVRNEAFANQGVGIRVENAEDIELERNRSTVSADHGFLVITSTDVRLRRNEADENDGDGIHIGAGVARIGVSDNVSSRHPAPRHDLRDEDGSCTDTRWLRNDFTRGFPACVN